MWLYNSSQDENPYQHMYANQTTIDANSRSKLVVISSNRSTKPIGCYFQILSLRV